MTDSRNFWQRIVMYLLALAIPLLCVSCAATRPVRKVTTQRRFDYDNTILAGMSDRGLSLAIAPSRSAVHSIEVMLKNEGARPLCIYSRFVVDCGQYDASPNVFVTVERVSNGERMPRSRSTWTQGGRETSARWFRKLEPMEYHWGMIDLSRFFALRRGEEYRVIVEYHNLESGYDSHGWREMNAWVGRLQSNPIMIK